MVLVIRGNRLQQRMEIGSSHHRVGCLFQCHRGWFEFEIGPFIILLQRNALEEQRIPVQVDMNRLQLPESETYLILFDREESPLLEPAKQSSSESYIADEVAAHTQNSVLPTVSNQITGHAAEYPSFSRWWMKVRRRFEVKAHYT